MITAMVTEKKLINIFSLILTIITTSCCNNTQHANDFQKHVTRSLNYLQEKRYKEALREINYSIIADSTKSYAFVIRGKIESSLDNDLFAIQDFSKAIEINPNNTSAFFYKAVSFSLLNNEDSAIFNYNLAINTKRSGKFYFDRPNKDFTILDNQTDIGLATIRYFRGLSLYNKKDDSAALQDFRYSLNENYNKGGCQFYIGVILLSQGDKLDGCANLMEAKINGKKEADEYITKYCR
ncbi:MAG: hypothetical protein JSS98_05755 [Bacteroidetes bacterium]|nr:hypothetical protein [Bacteroidota bacterium]